MQLISQINEASGIPIDDLKKVMQKDARIKQVFGTRLDVDAIQNPVEFLKTIKFFLLDNRNVLDFVEGRDYVRQLSKSTLKKLRELRPVDLQQKDIDLLQQFVSELFREHSYVEKSGMTASTRKEVLDWVNANGRYFNLSSSAQRELQSLPNVHPNRPTLLYRGLLFSASDLRERKRYDGQLEVGKGLAFLRAVRDGTRIVDLEWDRASSWSTHKDVALKFAQFSSANSNFEATMNWLHNAGSGKKIHGELGFLISTLAQPEDVLLDVRRMVTNAHMKHGDEGEFILKPGKYTCRISTKFSKADGEVDPIASTKVDDKISGVVEATKEFAKTWATDGPWDALKSDDWRTIDVERELRDENITNFGILARASTKEAAIKAYDQLRSFYHEHIDDLTGEQLETLSANKSVGKIVRWVSDLHKAFNEKDRHKDFKTSDNSRGDTKHKNLSSEQAREATWTPLSDKVATATRGGRFTDWSVASGIQTLLKAFTGLSVKELNKAKGADQQKHIDAILKSFFEKFELEQPPEREEAIRKMRSALMGAERNAALLNKIINLRSELNSALGTTDE